MIIIYLGVPWGAPGSKLVVVSSIMGCWEFLLTEIWNPELSLRNPDPTNDWKPESKFYWQVGNSESNTVFDYPE